MQNLLAASMPVILRIACATERFRLPRKQSMLLCSCGRGGMTPAEERGGWITLTAIQHPGGPGIRTHGPRPV